MGDALDDEDVVSLRWTREFIDVRTFNYDGEAGRAIGLIDRLLALHLKPRAVALLVALRKEPRAPQSLSFALAESRRDVNLLLRATAAEGLITATDHWVKLTSDGIAWLQRHGLDAEYRP